MSSVLGATAVVIGNIRGEGDLEIRGKVQGDVHTRGRILIADQGQVLGSIDATQITVAGLVRGNVNGQDGIQVEASGQIEGDLAAPRVGIEAGARVRGSLRTGMEVSGKQPPEPADEEPASLGGPKASTRLIEGKKQLSVKESRSTGQAVDESQAEAEDGPSYEKKRRRKRKASRKKSEASATNSPPSGEPTESPGQNVGAGHSPQPMIPTFVKGAKGHRR
ncbi:MAG: polymer-forming cytoskeletal protein [Polyangiaceae bacterium]|nr:polymer-forming cytoskeletal protein [Polyangiaceae bacterium]